MRPRQGVAHTFVADVSGLKRVELVLRTPAGESRLAMRNQGLYPSQTGARVTADYFTADLPVGAGDVRYFIEAEDQRGQRLPRGPGTNLAGVTRPPSLTPGERG
jgi:hypothetical protein